MAVVRHKEAIHSGHFMVSNFEAEAQDDEEDIAVPVSERMILRQNVMAINMRSVKRTLYIMQRNFIVLYHAMVT